MKRFSDICDEKVLDGDKIKIDDLLNQEIIILDYRVRESKFSKDKNGKYLTLQISMNEEKKVVFTGSDVLIEQIEKYGSQLPFVAVIKKISKYYTLT